MFDNLLDNVLIPLMMGALCLVVFVGLIFIMLALFGVIHPQEPTYTQVQEAIEILKRAFPAEAVR